MKTFPILDKEGKLHAFEVPNILFGRRAVLRLVSQIPGVSVIQRPKIFSWFREKEFCKFKVAENLFVVEEPFGDNSRFLVSAEPPGWCQELEAVENAFSKA